jgi:pantoate kinase
MASGSIGAGLLLEPPLKARLILTGTPSIKLLLQGRPSPLPKPVKMLINMLEQRGVKLAGSIIIESPKPIGAGYGVSGALSLAIALLASIYSGRSLEWGVRLAHVAEVVSGTGLGDVVTEYYSCMLEARLVPGGPGLARVVTIPVSARFVVTSVIGFRETSSIHSLMAHVVANEGLKAFTRFAEAMDLESFLHWANEFSKRVGFASNVDRAILDSIVRRGMAVGWYVKKGVLVVIPEEEYVDDVVAALKGLKPHSIYVDRVARIRARVVPCKSPEATQGTGA